jgi:hypothetical protein
MSMPELKATPGPWAITPVAGLGWIIPAAHLGRKIGFSVDPVQNERDYAEIIARPEGEPDARLIAAAPELYEADAEALDTFIRLRADLAEEDAALHAQRIAVIDIEIERLTSALAKVRGDQ